MKNDYSVKHILAWVSSLSIYQHLTDVLTDSLSGLWDLEDGPISSYWNEAINIPPDPGYETQVWRFLDRVHWSLITFQVAVIPLCMTHALFKRNTKCYSATPNLHHNEIVEAHKIIFSCKNKMLQFKSRQHKGCSSFKNKNVSFIQTNSNNVHFHSKLTKDIVSKQVRTMIRIKKVKCIWKRTTCTQSIESCGYNRQIMIIQVWRWLL